LINAASIVRELLAGLMRIDTRGEPSAFEIAALPRLSGPSQPFCWTVINVDDQKWTHRFERCSQPGLGKRRRR
jgi:hypothetical protein